MCVDIGADGQPDGTRYKQMTESMTVLDWSVIGLIACAYIYIIYKFEEIGGGK